MFNRRDITVTWTRRAILFAMLMLIVLTPATLAQSQRFVNLYSVWIQLSLRGYPQEEIESLLRNMDTQVIADVKNRLRRTVISNLTLKKVGRLYLRSRDTDDLNIVRSTIETELRFSGLQNDEEIKMLIQEQFGIDLTKF